MEQQNVRNFFEMWRIYDFLLERNYMFHREIYADVAVWLRERFGSQPFSMVDLGCGNARYIAQALESTGVARFVGLDLSDAPLAEAGRQLSKLGCEVELRQGNFMEAMERSSERFDLIFSSYSLHHFQTAEKRRFFELARRNLNPNGAILLIDTAREDSESREESLNNYCEWIGNAWTDVPAAAREPIFGHILSSDYPETNGTMHELAAGAGFSQRRDVNKHLWHRTWAFA
jgi:ubiquinone/menaquinone biosynthesis C-methylase UbiE